MLDIRELLGPQLRTGNHSLHPMARGWAARMPGIEEPLSSVVRATNLS
jgi:hypothetical protein